MVTAQCQLGSSYVGRCSNGKSYTVQLLFPSELSQVGKNTVRDKPLVSLLLSGGDSEGWGERWEESKRYVKQTQSKNIFIFSAASSLLIYFSLPSLAAIFGRWERSHRKVVNYSLKAAFYDAKNKILCSFSNFFAQYRAGIFKQSMKTRNRVGKGLSYRPASLQRLAEFIPWNRFLGFINV